MASTIAAPPNARALQRAWIYRSRHGLRRIRVLWVSSEDARSGRASAHEAKRPAMAASPRHVRRETKRGSLLPCHGPHQTARIGSALRERERHGRLKASGGAPANLPLDHALGLVDVNRRRQPCRCEHRLVESILALASEPGDQNWELDSVAFLALLIRDRRHDVDRRRRCGDGV